MINKTVAELEAAAASLTDPKNKAELTALVARLKSELNELQGKHESLRVSLKGFETTHPQLTEAVNELAGFLAKLGI